MTWLFDWLLGLGERTRREAEEHHDDDDEEDDDEEDDEWEHGLS